MKGTIHEMELKVLEGASKEKVFALTGDAILGRADPSRDWKPDIDLSPDFKVSRKHARVYWKSGAWWIEDLGSHYGTFLGGKPLKDAPQPTRILPGAAIRTGTTLWTFGDRNLCSFRWGGLVFTLKAAPAINYSLHHCSIPILSQLTITNPGDAPQRPFRLDISIQGYSTPWQSDIEPLAPGKIFHMERIPLLLKHEVLKGQTQKAKTSLTVGINGETVFEREIEILGFYEWSFDVCARKSLACFVQPAHPAVLNIVAEAAGVLDRWGLPSSFEQTRRMESADGAMRIVQAIYECLREKYTIRYEGEASSFEPGSQNIRPPHHVVTNMESRQGEGTCIDLALLMAGCLENVHLQPLVILTGNASRPSHALLGCWRDVSERYKPVITEFGSIGKALQHGGLILVETTGVTDNHGRGGLSFKEAEKRARQELTRETFVFALDVAAARQTVVPLQFPLSPKVTRVFAEAERLARDEAGGKLEVRHILLAFLQNVDLERGIRGVLRYAGVTAERMVFPSRAEGKPTDAFPMPTINYRRCLEDARIIAGEGQVMFVEGRHAGKYPGNDRVMFVDEEHLFYALLLSQSESVDRVFEQLGADRRTLKGLFEGEFKWKVVETTYET